jgi:arylsulfatase A-like enzyme
MQLSLLTLYKPLFLPLISILQITYIAKAFLYKKTNIQLNASHLRFLKTPRLFFDSAISLGFFKWLPFFIFVPLFTYCSLLFSFEKLSFINLLPFVLIGLCYKFTPANNHNFLLHLLLTLMVIPFSKKRLTHSTVPEELIPKCETFTKIDDEKYPLLKITEGFTGKKQFTYTKKSSLEKPNIVFIFLESFRAKNVGCLGAKKGVTPCFDALAKKGILFTQFYANGTSTESALWSTFFGIPQVFHKQGAIWETNYTNPNYEKHSLISLADILKKEGYANLLLDASSLALDKKGFFLKNHGFDHVIGKEELPPLFSHNSSSSWGIDDEHLFSFAVEKIKNHKTSPLFTSIFTISNHHPWKSPKNYNLKPFAEVSPPIYRNFLKTMHYTDKCLSDFVLNPLLKDSLFFIFGDHGMTMNERSNKIFGKRNLYEEGIHVPLLIYGDNIKKGKIISDLASQIDILPTVMDLLDIKGLNHSVGTSLTRKAFDKTLFFHEPPFLGNGFGIRKKEAKLIIENETSFLFDLHKDKKELKPLKDTQKTAALKKSIDEVSSCLSTVFHTNSFTYPVDKKGKSLTSFDGNESLIKDTDLEKLIKTSPYLEALNLSNCHLISDRGLQLISEHLPRLKSINCSYNLDITGEVLSTKKREWITANFKGCNRITDKGLNNISSLAPLLKNLSISCKSITNRGLNKSLLRLSSLTDLTLTDCNDLCDHSIKNLKNQTLNKLQIHEGVNFTDKMLSILANQPLYSLEISGASKITEKGFEAISHHRLNKLIFLETIVPNKAINSLKNLPLRALALSSCHELNKKSFEKLFLLDIELIVLKNCNPKLKTYISELIAERKTPQERFITFLRD